MVLLQTFLAWGQQTLTMPVALFRALSKLLFCLVLLPILLTFLQLTHVLTRERFVVLERTTSNDIAGGIYRLAGDGVLVPIWQPQLCEAFSPSTDSLCSNYPSITQLSQLLSNLKSVSPQSDYLLTVSDQQKWSLVRKFTNQTMQVLQQSSTEQPLLLTGEGNPRQIWSFLSEKPESSSSNGSIDGQRTAHGFRRNPSRRRPVRNGLLNQILNLPATTLLLGINIGLYLLYWNYEVHPATVALNGNVLQDYGRAFSGSLAHFEIWHVGFNMMSLSSLGQDLEPTLGSIPFFLWNVSLIPITTLLLLGLRQMGNRLARSQDNAPFPNIVGFSGVLFAWMVIVSLDRPRTCPIPFLPDTCFDTYHFLGLSLNVGPLVQLVVAQVILPRACFSGHLAGIMAGFLIHWKLLRLEWVQPCILFPFIWFCGKVLLERIRLLRDVAVSVRSGPGAYPYVRGFRIFMGVLCVYFIWSFPAASASLLVSQGLLCAIYFLFCSVLEDVTLGGVIGRGYMVLTVVSIVTDSMTMGGWLATYILFPGVAVHSVPFGLRIISHLVSLTLVAKYLQTTKQLDDGVLLQVFGKTVIDPVRSINFPSSAVGSLRFWKRRRASQQQETSHLV